MRTPASRVWPLVLWWLHPARALTLEHQGSVSSRRLATHDFSDYPPAAAYPNSHVQCAGGHELPLAEMSHSSGGGAANPVSAQGFNWLGLSSESQVSPDPFPRPASLLDGSQWCSGGAPRDFLHGRVALVMVGHPFRAKDYFTDHHATCTPGTAEVQRRLVDNHLDMIVRPIEMKGMFVDVFLTDIGCVLEIDTMQHTYMNSRTSDAKLFGGLDKLKTWYGNDRVRGVAEILPSQAMFTHVRMALQKVQDSMLGQNGTYEYVVVLRYDVFLDRPFLGQAPAVADPAHRSLSFFQRTHDYMFGFPGEMWNCMLHLWVDCLEPFGCQICGEPPEWRRERAGCYRFGPLELLHWRQFFGYDAVLNAIRHNLTQSRHWELISRVGLELRKNGTSAFDIDGREHRCVDNWYWPPKASFEHRFMPSYYHAG